MKIELFPFEQLPQLSRIDIAYQNGNELLKPFYQYATEIDNVREIIKNKNFNTENRNNLKNVLLNQYKNLNTSDAVKKNIDSLQSASTFTVTTAHQPVLFGGPLFFVYKICSTINLSIQLNAKYPEFNFVPIYWMGEDHDFDEVNHLSLFGKKIIWDDYQGGPVANYKLSSLQAIIMELFRIIGNGSNAEELKEIISECYKPEFSFGEATFIFVDRLFSKYGLIVIRPESKELKRTMIPVFKEELLKNSSYDLVNETVKKLEFSGFGNQAHARPVNLFYLLPGKRLRIEKINGVFQVLHTDISFEENEIIEELNNFPERFSPNVILRPLYQETILPNVAFIGGGGEIAYWLERKLQFDHYKVPYPMILRRNSLTYLDAFTLEKMENLGIDFSDINLDTDLLIKKYLSQQNFINFTLESEKKEIENSFQVIAKKAKEKDKTLESVVKAQLIQTINSIEKIEEKLFKIEKKRQENAINQIRKIQEKLYLPSNLQERNENFMSMYLKYGRGLFDFLISHLNPFQKYFMVLKDKNQ